MVTLKGVAFSLSWYKGTRLCCAVAAGKFHEMGTLLWVAVSLYRGDTSWVPVCVRGVGLWVRIHIG